MTKSMMKQIVLLTTIISLFCSPGGFAQPLNITKERYIEVQHIEVLWNAGGTGGILLVRTADCSECTSHTYTFNELLEVLVDGKKFGISRMKTWTSFSGDIIVTKGENQLVAVKRTR